jgi:hypothetical protein
MEKEDPGGKGGGFPAKETDQARMLVLVWSVHKRNARQRAKKQGRGKAKQSKAEEKKEHRAEAEQRRAVQREDGDNFA